jgi:hypothetical protein
MAPHAGSNGGRPPCDPTGSYPQMCNLYSITRSQEAMRRLFRVKRDLTRNLPILPGICPDTMAPVVCIASDGERELTMMRWGFPSPPNLSKAPVTNVRNLKFAILEAENRVALSRSGDVIQRASSACER